MIENFTSDALDILQEKFGKSMSVLESFEAADDILVEKMQEYEEDNPPIPTREEEFIEMKRDLFMDKLSSKIKQREQNKE